MTPVALIAAQPDMGTALTFVPLYLAALLMGGVRWKVIVGLALVTLLLALASVLAVLRISLAG